MDASVPFSLKCSFTATRCLSIPFWLSDELFVVVLTFEKSSYELTFEVELFRIG